MYTYIGPHSRERVPGAGQGSSGMTHCKHRGERRKAELKHGRRQAKASGIMKCGVIFCPGGQASEHFPGIFAVERVGEA